MMSFVEYQPTDLEVRRVSKLFVPACVTMFDQSPTDSVLIRPIGRTWLDTKGNQITDSFFWEIGVEEGVRYPQSFYRGTSEVFLIHPDNESQVSSATVSCEWVDGRGVRSIDDVVKYSGRVISSEVKLNLYDVELVDGYVFSIDPDDGHAYRQVSRGLHAYEDAIRLAMTIGDPELLTDRELKKTISRDESAV
jgi:hypothetical protein